MEVVAGLISNSLALLADAGHMATDVVAMSLALFAIWIAVRPASFYRTFGFYRAETLVALVNTVSLAIIAVLVFMEAYRRFSDPPEPRGVLMLAAGLLGLLVNIAAFRVLKRSAGESLNVEGAFLHVVGDLLGSLAVVVASVLILTLGWAIADPIFGLIIGLLILSSAGRLIWKVLHVLMEGTPVRLDLQSLCRRLEQVKGVTGVHDIHAWSITSGYEVLSAHVTADLGVNGAREVLSQLKDIASGEFGIDHVTIQLEDSPERCVESHHISHAR